MTLIKLIKAMYQSVLLNARYILRGSARFKSVVEKYPDTISAKGSGDMFANFRGYVRNDLAKCNGCGVCVPACPVKALEFESASKADGSIEVKEFRINLGKCYSCSACIDVCPETSLFYSRDFELISNKPQNLVMILRGQPVRGVDRDITRIRTYEVRR